MNLEDLDILPWAEKAWSQPFSKDDVLFRSIEIGKGVQEDWEMNAWVRGATPYAYAEGYRLAARLVADFVIRKRWESDFLVYPIAFLYRHNVELQLKMLILDGAVLTAHALSETDRRVLKSSHRLDQLWEIFAPILRKLGTDFGITSAAIEAIDSYIHQIHNIDELSFSFRYMTTKAGVPSIDKDKLPLLNVGVLATCMERLTAYLFGLGVAMHDAMKVQDEMNAEACAEEARCMEYYGDY